MASSSAPPKSILKKAAAENTKAPRQAEAKEIALEHARILQKRKETEEVILDSVIELSEHPSDRTTDPANPDLDDAAEFKDRVRLFQPSDYDALVEERNVNGLCGYTLCRRPHRDTGPGGEWKISGATGQILRRRDVEKWCSRACAERALWVKVQLLETAAWERAGMQDIVIELLDESRKDKKELTAAERVAQTLEAMKLEDSRQAARDSAALALERGEPQTAKPGSQTSVPIRLKERKPVAPTIPASGQEIFEDEDHLVVEGYKAKIKDNPNTTT